MAHERRSYGQYCGLASALDIVGERWTLLILRELLVGPCRYNELLAQLPGIGTNLLADRLKYLVQEGLIMLSPSGNGSKGKQYELTEAGEALRGPVLGLARWGLDRMDAPKPEYAVRPRWSMLAVEAIIDEQRAANIDETYEFDIDSEIFHVDVRQGTVKLFSGPADQAVLTIKTDARTFVDIGSGRLGPLEASLSRRLSMEGDMAAVLRCCQLLGLATGESVNRA